MTQHVRENLRRLLTQLGWTLDEVAERSGLDRRTIRGILEEDPPPPRPDPAPAGPGARRRQQRAVSRPRSQLLYRHFDRQTNPVVTEVVQERPELFAGWTEADFDELHSRVGTGGPLTAEGTATAAAAMNRNRSLHEKLALLLETGQAELIRAIVETMYDQVVDKK